MALEEGPGARQCPPPALMEGACPGSFLTGGKDRLQPGLWSWEASCFSLQKGREGLGGSVAGGGGEAWCHHGNRKAAASRGLWSKPGSSGRTRVCLGLGGSQAQEAISGPSCAQGVTIHLAICLSLGAGLKMLGRALPQISRVTSRGRERRGEPLHLTPESR